MAPRKQAPSPAEQSSAPKILEVSTSVALNGSVAVKKYDIKSGYHFGITERYSTDGLSQEEVEAFEDARLIELYDKIDPVAQAEFDKLWAQRIETGE